MSRESSELSPAGATSPTSANLDPLLQELRRRTAASEQPGASVRPQLAEMADAGVMRWGIPAEYGGRELSALEQTEGISRIASACLVSSFVLSQRNAAVSRIVASDNRVLKAELLPRLARHELMATVGISHLTTSRQHLSRPAVTAAPDGDAYSLSGEVPWVTAGTISDLVLTGGTLTDGRQILALVDSDAPGVTIGASPELLALNASRTGPVSLDRVCVARERIVAGPADAVMKSGAAGAGSITTSALALGLADKVCLLLTEESSRRPELHDVVRSFRDERDRVWADMRTLLAAAPAVTATPVTSESIRARANSLVLRVSQAYLSASKGAGFVKGHPAERAVREAMFFLVWSCPQPVVNAALRSFACLTG